jgi:hypothetical protein
MRAKGVPTKVVKTSFDIKLYEDTLYNNSINRYSSNAIRSYNHKVHSVTGTKLGLGSYDNKRYYLNVNESLAHGHYKIAKL